MEKRKVNINEMYQYTTTGSTLYDLLGSYVDLTDFSAESILNTLRRDINLQQHTGDPKKIFGFSNVYNNDIHGRIIDSMLENTTPKEKEELLEKLQAVNPELYKFPGLLEYIGFLQDVNFTPRAILAPEDNEKKPVLNQDIDKLNTILIDTAVSKADPEMVSRIRKVLIQMILIPYARRQISKDEQEDENIKSEKLYKMKLLDKIYSKQELIQEYDDIIASTKEHEKMAMDAAKLRINCKLTRLAALAELTGKPMSELLETIDSYDKTILDSITSQAEQSGKPYFPQEGDYTWRFSPFKMPKVVLHDTISYSEDGDKDQEIILASYGNFLYTRNLGTSKYEEAPLELVGVTTFAKDGNRNYFLVTPEANTIQIRNNVDLEQYKKILLSEFVLDDAVSSGYRFLPQIVFDENQKCSLRYDNEISLVDSRPVDAVRYANIFRGSVGRSAPSVTLQELCNSQQLFEQQMRMINELRYRKKNDTNREDR